MTLILMMRLERMNAGRGDDVACIGGTTAEMNVDSRGYVSCSGDYFTGSEDYILIRGVI